MSKNVSITLLKNPELRTKVEHYRVQISLITSKRW